MSTPEAQKTLAIIDLAGDKWEGSPGTDEWYSIIAYGNDKLTAHDAEIAVGGTLANVQSFASTHYLAYAKRLRMHRPGRSDS